MTDLLTRIETILAENAKQQAEAFSITGWSGEQIAEALTLELPRPQNEREKRYPR